MPFLDGLRGLAALYVLLFHVIADGQPQFMTDSILINLLRFGREAVVVFIVLSGFVLALPISRSPQLKLSGGCRSFFKRRARRILPAYYAALFLLPVYLLGVEGLKHLTGAGVDWNRLADLFISADMVSHLFMLHIFSSDWFISINPVLWSLAVEWWIYFIFALVLLPIWRHFGVIQAALFSVGLGLMPTALLLLGGAMIFFGAHLLGAFGLGMVSAGLLFEDQYADQLASWRTHLIIVAAVAVIVFVGLVVYMPTIHSQEETSWVLDLLTAVVSAISILLIASAKLYPPATFSITRLAGQILEAPPLTILGQFSYSIYLTHLVVWAIVSITLNLDPVKHVISFSLDPMLWRILVLIPLLLVCAYGFYLLFEKPFLNQRR